MVTIPMPDILIESPLYGETSSKCLIHDPEVRRHLDELLVLDEETGVPPLLSDVAAELSRRIGQRVSSQMIGSWRRADPEFWEFIDWRYKEVWARIGLGGIVAGAQKGDFQSSKFLLTNVAPDQWKDKQQVEHSVDESFAAALSEARLRLTESERPKELEADARVVGDE